MRNHYTKEIKLNCFFSLAIIGLPDNFHPNGHWGGSTSYPRRVVLLVIIIPSFILAKSNGNVTLCPTGHTLCLKYANMMFFA